MGHFGDKSFAIAAGVPWLEFLIWSVLLTNKSLIDQFEDNLTGKGKRKSVDTIGSLD